jgi:hypothetical protein
MKCRDMKEMLSAYANGELSQSEIDKVGQHLAGCAECRSTLEAYRNVRQKISILQGVPANSEIKEAIMADIRANNAGRKPSLKWLKPALIGIPVVAGIIVGLMIWQPWRNNNGWQNIIVRAQIAISNIQSYRMTEKSVFSVEGQTPQKTASEEEFVAPDRYHQKSQGNVFGIEFIHIGDKLYYKGPDMKWSGTTIQSQSPNDQLSLVSREYTAMMLKYLENTKTLPDETIDGVTCLHYRGEFDFEKQLRDIQQQAADNGISPLSEEELSEQFSQLISTAGQIVNELWIGKDDYLIRRMTSDAQRIDSNGKSQSSQMEMTFSDFNSPIVIEAPLDTDGNLLAGWTSISP